MIVNQMEVFTKINNKWSYDDYVPKSTDNSNYVKNPIYIYVTVKQEMNGKMN